MTGKSLRLAVLWSLFAFNELIAADYFWIGGAGNWSDISHWVTTSGGTVQHNTIPTASDRVFFDARSFTGPNQVVTVNNPTIYCRDMNWTGATGRPVFVAPAGFVLEVHGSLILTPDMVFDFRGDVLFFATAAGNQINLAGHKLMRNSTFSSNGGGWTLQGAFRVDSLLLLSSGTFQSAGQAITCELLRIQPSGNLQIDLDTSRVTITGVPYFLVPWGDPEPVAEITLQTQLNLNASNAMLDFNSPDVFFRIRNSGTLGLGTVLFSSTTGKSLFRLDAPNNLNLRVEKLEMRNDSELKGPMKFGELVLGPGKNFKLNSGYTYELQKLTAQGTCAAPIQLFGSEPGSPVTLRSSATAITGLFLSLRDIQASGGAVFTASNSADLGNNTGWTITPKSNTALYWVGGSGMWNDPANWALSSGGPGGSCVPTAGDDVFFDQNSFSFPGAVVLINIDNAYCRSMNWTGATGNPVLLGTSEKNLHIFGSLTFVPAMRLDFEGDIYFESNAAGNSITSAGRQYRKNAYFDGQGSWILNDSLSVTRSLFFKKGNLSTNDQVMACQWFNSESSTARSLKLGKSHVKLRSPDYNYLYWWLNADNLTFDAGTSTIEYFWNGDLRHLGTPQLTYHKVIFNYGSSLNSDYDKLNHIIDTLEMRAGGYFSSSTQVGTWRISRGVVYTMHEADTLLVDNIVAFGGCTGMIEFRSSQRYRRAFIANKVPVTLDRIVVQDMHSIGPGTITATNSVNLGNSDGWVIGQGQGRTLFWVGGRGAWHETEHWSLSSGGPGGECAPTPVDDVIFDQNSFSAPSQQVDMDLRVNYCKNMTWRNQGFSPVFRAIYLHIFGSVDMTPEMRATYLFNLVFRSEATDNNIKIGSAGRVDFLDIMGGGSFFLQDSIQAHSLSQGNGTFHSNGQLVNIDYFTGGFWETKKVLAMGGSHWKVNGRDQLWRGSWNIYLPMTFQVDSSLVEFTNPSARIYSGHPFAFHNVLFSAVEQQSKIDAVANVSGMFNHLEFRNNGVIIGGHTIDSLIFSPGKSYQLDASKAQVVREYLQMNGNNCLSIGLSSTVAGQKSKVIMNGGVVSADFVQMRDQTGEGSTRFFAGNNSTNIGNSNTGWVFESAEDYVDDGILGRDIVLCKASAIELDGRTYSPGETYRWSTGARTPTIAVSQPGTYWVELRYGDNCVLRDSIILLEAAEFIADLPADTALCAGDTLRLEPGIELLGLKYLWQDSSTKSSFVVRQPGKYKLTLELTGCTASDSLTVSYVPTPPVNLGADQRLCPGQTTILNAALPGATAYRWQDGSTSPAFVVSSPGAYVAQVFNGRCSGQDTVNVAYEAPLNLGLGRDTLICEGSNLTLSPMTSGGGNIAFRWHNGSGANTFVANMAGIFWVEATRNGCSERDSIQVSLKPLPRFELGPDTSLCEGQELQLSGSSLPGSTYLWNTGAQSDSITVRTSGVYRLAALLNGCRFERERNVTFRPLPALELGPTIEKCQGEKAVLDATFPGAVYRWQDGTTSAKFETGSPGVFQVVSTLNGCARSDSVEVRFKPLPVFSLGRDTILCEGETLPLRVDLPGATVLWNNGNTSNTIQVATPGLFWLQATLNGCVFRDSMSVAFTLLPANRLGADRTLCQGQTTTLDATVSGANYLWQNGTTLPQLSVGTSGAYQVRISVGRCSIRDTVSVNVLPLPVFDLGRDTQLCAPAALLLRVAAPADSYRWQDGSSQATFTARQSGLLRATAVKDGCSWTDSLRIEVFQPRKPNLGQDTVICENTVFTLRADVAAQSLRWQDGSTDSRFDVKTAGQYILSVFEGPCAASDTVSVSYRRCTVFKAFLPNAFSPNGDGINDAFRPLMPPDIEITDYIFRVFDRWGNLVFETSDTESAWDGTYRGSSLPQGVFLYYVSFKYKDDFEEDFAKFTGDILLTR
jgi:gliding motility-associated-like protein